MFCKRCNKKLTEKQVKRNNLFCSQLCCNKFIHGKAKRTLSERFWEKVDKSGECWEWTATTIGGGYGSIHHNKRMRYAHRVSFELTYGKIPDGLDVLHTCDNPLCVNPSHLRLGTHRDNMQDMIKKGRGNKNKGVKVGTAKLNPTKVRKIRSLYSTGNYTMKQLGKQFNVDTTQICNIVNRKHWKHID